jgi:membrane associated rhomboid family serine protease
MTTQQQRSCSIRRAHAMGVGNRMPIIGASGAVAGVLGAFLWLFPHARIVALVPIMFFGGWLRCRPCSSCSSGF